MKAYMAKPLNPNEEAQLEGYLETFRSMDIPPAPTMAIEELVSHISFRTKHTQVPVPALSAAAMAFAVIMIFVVFQYKSASREHPGIPTSCVIQSVSGHAFVKDRSSARYEKQAHAGLFLEEGAHILTDANTLVQLRAGEEVSIEMASEAEISMEKLRWNSEDSSKDLVFSLMKGRILCQVDKLHRPVNVVINTPEASFEVWGTRFEVIRKVGMGSHVAVFEGNVLVTPREKGVSPVHVPAGFKSQVLKNKRLKKPEVHPIGVSEYADSSRDGIPEAAGLQKTGNGGILKQSTIEGENISSIEHVFEDKSTRP